MAVDQKHFYGNDNLWNRWSPRQILELDQAMRQLKGRKLKEWFTVKPDGSTAVDHTVPSVRKFDLAAFRYNGSAEVPLLRHREITRTEARNVLSYMPGWGAIPTDAAYNTSQWLFGDAILQFEESVIKKDRGKAHGEQRFLDVSESVHMQKVYDTIHQETFKGHQKGFASFLFNHRLSEKTKEQNMAMLTNESWSRLFEDVGLPIDTTIPQIEVDEDYEQGKVWDWLKHAYGVVEDPKPGRPKYPKHSSKEHCEEAREGEARPRLTQWVIYSQAEPLKGVEGGYTHQPWTNPWFFEYSSNTSSTRGLRPSMPHDQAQGYLDRAKRAKPLAIRGYAFEMQLRGTLRYKFHLEDVLDSRGGVKNLDLVLPWEKFSDSWTYLTAITDDGRAFRRQLSETAVETDDGKKIWDVLDADGKPLYTEQGELIKLTYDTKMGLAETRYGRAVVPLDKFMGSF